MYVHVGMFTPVSDLKMFVEEERMIKNIFWLVF